MCRLDLKDRILDDLEDIILDEEDNIDIIKVRLYHKNRSSSLIIMLQDHPILDTVFCPLAMEWPVHPIHLHVSQSEIVLTKQLSLVLIVLTFR